MSEVPWPEVAKAVIVMGADRLPAEELARWLDALAESRVMDTPVLSDGHAGSG